MTQLIDLGKLRFHFAGAWLNTTVYESNDIVRYGGNVYVYIHALRTSGNLPTDPAHWALMIEGINFIGEWTTGAQYFIGDAVAYGSTVYVAIADNIASVPDTHPSSWSQFVEAIQWEGDYVATTSYQPNDVVKYGGSAYIALQTTNGNDPTNATYWDQFVTGISPEGVYNGVTAYVPNDIVAYGANLYVATANTTGHIPTSTAYWQPFMSSFESRGAWQSSTLYYVNDLVRFGANAYACTTQNTSGTFATDLAAGKWSLFTSGLRQRGAWVTATEYLPYDIISYGGNTYSCVLINDSGSFATDLAAGKWQIFNGGIRWRNAWAPATSYLLNDLVINAASTYIATQDFTSGTVFSEEYDLGKWAFFAKGNQDVLPVITSADKGFSVTVAANGVDIEWINNTGSANTFYVTPGGNDSNPGTSLALPFASIKAACAAASAGGATIIVKSGTYIEASLPIVVPPHTAIVGESQRTVNVQPASGLAQDGLTLNAESTMWAMSNGSILNKMTFKGMTGWVPGTTPEDVTTSTHKGIVVGFNPASPVSTKSPYVLECAFIGTGAIGALIDGSVHSTGAKTMIFHGYTVISDNGIGYWVKDGGKAEIVSCFTYYCYFGYTASGGGFIRALNGNNSYGTWGATSQGYDASETALTGTVYGRQLNFLYGGGNINVGDTLTTNTGATLTVTNAQITANKLYSYGETGTFASGDTFTTTSGGSGTVYIGALEDQKGFILVLTGLSTVPVPGASISLLGDSYAYVIQSVTGTYVDTTSKIVVVLAQEKPMGSASGTSVSIRYKYTQIRLTGHDFLSIGTGGIATTNYPGTPTQPSAQGNETTENYPGRVYYVSTDQDGNFRVGEYFRIDQATGRATLNASAFDLAGLTSLKLGSIGAQLGETINEFSSDATLSGNSNTAVPTEYAVKTYSDTRVPQALPTSEGNTGKVLTSNGTTVIYAAPAATTSLPFVSTYSENTSLSSGTMTFGMQTLSVTGDAILTIPTGAYFFVLNPDGFALFN